MAAEVKSTPDSEYGDATATVRPKAHGPQRIRRPFYTQTQVGRDGLPAGNGFGYFSNDSPTGHLADDPIFFIVVLN